MSEEIPPSFEPGSGRRIPQQRPTQPRPAQPARPEPAPPRRVPVTPQRSPGRGATRPQPSPTSARPIPISRPPAGAQPPGGSRTDSRVNATRAMPLSQAAPSGTAAPRPASPQPVARPPVRPSRATYRRRRLTVGLLVVLVLLLAWPIGLVVWANGKLQHVEALSGAANTPGTTYLIAGSDSRADGAINDGAEGQRTDTVMLLTDPAGGGTASLVSIPRDVVVQVPDVGAAKLNAAYAYGRLRWWPRSRA